MYICFFSLVTLSPVKLTMSNNHHNGKFYVGFIKFKNKTMYQPEIPLLSMYLEKMPSISMFKIYLLPFTVAPPFNTTYAFNKYLNTKNWSRNIVDNF